MTNAGGATRTSAFGYYRFDEVEAGQSYILSVRSKRYKFSPQVLSVTEDLEELNFVAEQANSIGAKDVSSRAPVKEKL